MTNTQHVVNTNCVRHLLIPLVNAERAWAHAQELKAAVAQGCPEAAPKRHHAIKRLSKAAAWAAQLAHLAGERADPRTALEAEAYSSWMSGSALLERETDWPAAVAAFLRAQTAYEQLAKVGDAQQTAAARALLTELGPALRYCRYKGGSASAAALDTLLHTGSGERASPLLDAGLAAKLEAVADAQRSSSDNRAGDTITLEGIQLGVPSSAARAALAAATAVDAELTQVARSNQESRLGLYDKLLMALADASSALRGDVTACAGAAGATSSLRGVAAALAIMSLRRTMERDGVLLEQALAKWAPPAQGQSTVQTAMPQSKRARKAAASEINKSGSGGSGAAQPAGRIADVIKLYDTLISSASALADTAQSHGGGFAEAFGGPSAGEAASSALATSATGEEGVFRARRTSALAQWHARSGRWAEAVALHDRAIGHATTALKCSDQLARNSAPAALNHAARIKELATNARDDARRGRVLAIVDASEAADATAAAESSKLTRRVALVALNDGDAVDGDDVGQQLDGAGAAVPDVPASQRYILDALDVFESAVTGLGTSSPDVRIFPIPPPMEAVAARPLFLDTALHELPLPSVKHRTGAASGAQGGAATSRLGRLTAGVSSLLGASRWMGGGAAE